MNAAQPEVLFHLAAQPLVRPAYIDPLYTFQTNIMGTANVLEAARHCPSIKTIVVITTDKCYENPESAEPFTEEAALGGHDPYSASKAGTEIVASSYYRSFFLEKGVSLATARAGNVVGGGDWAEARIVPDLIRAYDSGKPLTIRYPNATRPWQHVLEPVHGYTLLAEKLMANPALSSPWNFGPHLRDCVPVKELIEVMQEFMAVPVDIDRGPHPHEANFLRLDTTKSQTKLGWTPALNLYGCLKLTADWYAAALKGADMRDLTEKQIQTYKLALNKNLQSADADILPAKGLYQADERHRHQA